MLGLATQSDPDSGDSDNDEMDAIDDVEDQMSEFKFFKDLVVSFTSFERFKERFDLFVSPDQIRLAIFQQWPSLCSKSSRQQLSYDIECALESFIDNHVKDAKRLGELLTLTGDAVDAEALSVREYICRTCPDIGDLLLEGIELLLQHKSNGKSNAHLFDT